MPNDVITYQSRIRIDGLQEEMMQSYATLFNRVEHALYAEIAKGNKATVCKNEFLKRFKITARQFNAARVTIEGKIAAVKASQELAILDLKQKVQTLEKQIERLGKKSSKKFTIHQKQRRKNTLLGRLTSREEDQKRGHVRLCFGKKKLFHAQFHLEQNGFASHAEWKKVWEEERSNEFFILGSKDETSGNQTCVMTVQENEKLQLRLRLPDAVITGEKYLTISNVHFVYGQTRILEALKNKQAISYRFKKDAKSWKVFVSVEVPQVEVISKEENGVIGLDLNVDHIALVETDRFGNPIFKKKIPWICHGKSKERAKAMTSELCKEIISYAKKSKKPCVIEKLDFQKKRSSLREQNPKMARLLSSFAYKLFSNSLKAKASKEGILIHEVNPAFTSIIGQCNYAKRYGLSIHLAAALCIARRYQKFSEAPSISTRIPDGKGGHVAFALPVRNRTKHVWHYWKEVKKKLKTALAARFQAIKHQSKIPKPNLATVIPDCYG